MWKETQGCSQATGNVNTQDPPSGCGVQWVAFETKKKGTCMGALPATAPPTQSTLDEPAAGKHKSHPAPPQHLISALDDHGTPLHVFPLSLRP